MRKGHIINIVYLILWLAVSGFAFYSNYAVEKGFGGDVLVEVVGVLQSLNLMVIFGLILVDILLGISLAFKESTFDVNKLANFYKTAVLPYVLGYVVLHIAFAASLGLDSIMGAGLDAMSYSVLIASLAGQLKDKALALWPDITGT